MKELISPFRIASAAFGCGPSFGSRLFTCWRTKYIIARLYKLALTDAKPIGRLPTSGRLMAIGNRQ